MQINIFIDYNNRNKHISNSFDDYVLGDILLVDDISYKIREVSRVEYFYNEVVLVIYNVEVVDTRKEGEMI